MATCAFYASGLQMTEVFGVPIPLTVGTLCDVSRVLGWLEFDFALLKKVFVIWGRV
jgi:hypothetical protein